MSLFHYEEFSVWFPAIVVGFLISLLVAALWDFIRRRFWLFLFRDNPSNLQEVGLDSQYQSRAEAGDQHRETIDKLNEIARGMNFPISPRSPNSGATSAIDIEAQTMINLHHATHVIHMTGTSAVQGTFSISSSSENHMYPGETFQGVDCRPIINFTSYFPDGTPKDVTRPTKKLYKRHANGRVKRLRSSIILQAPMAIDAWVLAEIVELAKYCLQKENRCVFQLGNWAVLYHKAGKVQMHLLKEGDVPLNVEARWQDGKTGITMRGLYLTGSVVKVGTKQTSKILRSAGPATQGAGDLDELHLPAREFDIPGEDSLILSSKVVVVDGVSLIVRSEASFILPPREKNALIEAVWTRWLRISNFAKKMLRSLLFGAEGCQPDCAANRPELEFDPEKLELSVEHWKGLSEIELLNTRKEVLLHLQEQRPSGIIEPAGPPSPHSHLIFVRDEHYLEYWQQGLRILNEVIHRNSNDSHSHTHITVRGGIQFLLGDYESALQDLDLAHLNTGGHRSVVLLDRALVKCMLGRYSEAMQDVVEAITLNPDVNDIQELRASIQKILDQQRSFRVVRQSGPSCQRPLVPDEDNSIVKIPDLLTGGEWHSGEIGFLRPISDAGTAGGLAFDPPSKRAKSVHVARAAVDLWRVMHGDPDWGLCANPAPVERQVDLRKFHSLRSPWIAGVAAAGTSSPTSDGNGQNRLRGCDARTNPRMSIPVNEKPQTSRQPQPLRASGVDSVFPTISENSTSGGGSPVDSSSMNTYPGEWYMVRALEIIESTCTMSSNVCLNKHQCKRLADRCSAIGEGLEGLLRDENFNVGNASDGGNHKDYPAFDELLTVLRKGEALVSTYIDSKGIICVVSRAENRESFEEIHEELDTLKAQFDFESFSKLGQAKEFESSSGVERTNALAKDADQDLTEMPEDMALIKESKNIMGVDMEKAPLLVMKSGLWSPRDEVPSYLRIDPTAVRPVVLNSKRDTAYELGWSAFHRCKWMGCDFAAKVFKPAASDVSGWNNKQLLTEVDYLANLRHPHIVRLVGFGQDAEQCVILMELMDDDLRNFMRTRLESSPIPKPRPFKLSEELDIITQIAKGMRYMHTQQYVHRDLKCSNILVKKFDDYLDVKIDDLRSSQRLGKVWDAGAFKQASQTRRPRWTAPEAIDLYGGKEPPSELLKKSDVYSFGMTCYEIVTGKYPFDGIKEDELLKQIHAGVRPELPGDLDEDLQGLIRQCWDPKPNKRPEFGDIVYLLSYIRSKKPVVVWDKFSSQDMVLSLMKKIPQVRGAFTGLLGPVREGKEHAIDPSHDSSVWGVKSDGGFQRSDSALSVPEHLRIQPDKLHKVQHIGEGASARVYKATWLGCTFAVKVFKNPPLNIRALQQEVDFLISVSRHPCIAQMVGLSVDSDKRCSIVMEFMDGNLYDLIQSRMRKRTPVTAEEKGLLEGVVFPFDLHEALPIISKIALGMAFLHSKGVVHRDLKPTNVLVKELPGSIDVKLVDFGMSVHTHEIEGHYYYNGIGTGLWRAPEVFPVGLSSKKPDLRGADVYSFAITCYEILTGSSNLRHPERTLVIDGVIEGERPTLPALLHPGLKALVQQCWHADPVKRPNFTEICEELQKIRQSSSDQGDLHRFQLQFQARRESVVQSSQTQVYRPES